ncbi:MAG: DUF3300 domain-containing protein [Verrucomicrobiota bacterium]
MKLQKCWLPVILGATFIACSSTQAQEQPPVYVAPAPTSAAAPPAASPKLGQDELMKLVAPIALYPDPLLAILLPASAYPLEIVQAARFVENTNNLPQLDEQPWDSNVRAIARFPSVIQKMNNDLSWTIQLGQSFVNQPVDLMNAIQARREEARASGVLKTTAEQTVVVTNAVVERTYAQQVVYVTNTVVEIQPADPQVIYVPDYSSVVYIADPVYVNPLTPLIRFGAGIAIGAAIANNCDWYYGGVWVGGGGFVIWGGGAHPPYYPPPPGCRPPPYHPPPGYRPPPPGYRPPGYPPPGSIDRPRPTPYPAQPGYSGAPIASTQPARQWRPDEARRQNYNSAAPNPRIAESRGWQSQPVPTTRPTTGTVPPVNRANPQPAYGGNPAPGRPAVNQPAYQAPAQPVRPAQPVQQPAAQRPAVPSAPTAAPSVPVNNNAFNGINNGAAARDYSNRGAVSRGGGNVGGGRRR